jgi:large subunit ribosomal protein L21
MKKAIIATGGKQYLVKEGDIIEVELLKEDKKVEFSPLLIIDDKNIKVGKPTIDSIKVLADVIEPNIKTEKVTAIRYKAKKRVNKVHGHRQQKTIIKISKIG